MEKEDWRGRKFGRLTVVGPSEKRSRYIYWHCECDCGTKSAVRNSHLVAGTIRSCGCLLSEIMSARATHGMTRGGQQAAEHRIWVQMRNRCRDPLNARYGGRGIRVCDRWERSFEAFYADIGPRPGPAYSLDRIDNDGPYSPENCRWATRREQSNNTSTNHVLGFGGDRATITEWSRRTGLSKTLIRGRLTRGWSVEDALTRPPRPIRSRATG